MLDLDRPRRALPLVAAVSAMITLDAAPALAAEPVRPEEIIVAGSAVFGKSDPETAVRELREATIQWV